VLDYVGKRSLTWLTNIPDTDSSYEDEHISNNSDSYADNNTAHASKAGAEGRDAHRTEDDLRGTRRSQQDLLKDYQSLRLSLERIFQLLIPSTCRCWQRNQMNWGWLDKITDGYTVVALPSVVAGHGDLVVSASLTSKQHIILL